MKNFITDLNKDICIFKENNYWVKRYAYKKYNYIENDGTPITERMFSFILLHGKKWDNSTSLNFKESELDKVIPKYKEILAEKKAERKALLTEERSTRKEFPRHSKWVFDNVTITVVEDVFYINNSSVHGYFYEGKKSVTIYANEKPYRYCINMEYDKDFEITTDWMLEQISTHYVAQHNTTNLSSKYQSKPFSTVVIEKFDYSFVPYQFFIGYVVDIDGVEYSITDFKNRSYFVGFDTDKGEVAYPANRLNELSGKILAEASGSNAFVSLMNKLKYCE